MLTDSFFLRKFRQFSRGLYWWGFTVFTLGFCEAISGTEVFCSALGIEFARGNFSIQLFCKVTQVDRAISSFYFNIFIVAFLGKELELVK